MSHKEYKQKDDDMPDCPICLVNFVPDDELLVFSCDVKHYFHKKCGIEWLDVKTECPLCRADFTQNIHEFIEQNDDIINDVARQAIDANPSGNNPNQESINGQ